MRAYIGGYLPTTNFAYRIWTTYKFIHLVVKNLGYYHNSAPPIGDWVEVGRRASPVHFSGGFAHSFVSEMVPSGRIRPFFFSGRPFFFLEGFAHSFLPGGPGRSSARRYIVILAPKKGSRNNLPTALYKKRPSRKRELRTIYVPIPVNCVTNDGSLADVTTGYQSYG